MVWPAVVFSISGAAFALRLVLATPAPPSNSVAMAATGWPPRTLRIAAMTLGALIAGLVFVFFSAVADLRSGVLVGGAVAFWAPEAMSRLIRRSVLSTYRRKRDEALLEWLRRIRLYCTSGRPINDAALEAAEEIEAAAFAPVATSINLALASGRDPLSAAAEHFVGSTAETLVVTLLEAERAGAAASDLIDRLIGQAVQVLEDSRRARIEVLGRATNSTSTLIAAITSTVVVIALLAATRITV